MIRVQVLPTTPGDVSHDCCDIGTDCIFRVRQPIRIRILPANACTVGSEMNRQKRQACGSWRSPTGCSEVARGFRW